MDTITDILTDWHVGDTTIEEALARLAAVDYVVPPADTAAWDWDGGDGVVGSYGELAAARFALGLSPEDVRPFREALDAKASGKKVEASVRRLRAPSG